MYISRICILVVFLDVYITQQPPSQSRVALPLSDIWFVEYEAMWEDEWRHNFTIANDHPKHHDVDWMFGFHHYQTGQGNSCTVNSPCSRNVSHLRKKQSMFSWKQCSWVCLKALQHGQWSKLALSHLVWEIPIVFMY